MPYIYIIETPGLKPFMFYSQDKELEVGRVLTMPPVEGFPDIKVKIVSTITNNSSDAKKFCSAVGEEIVE